MNERLFDRFTRALATRAGRREALRFAVAALLAASGASRRRRDAGAQVPPGPLICRQDPECLDSDLDPCTGAACVDGLCVYFIVDCIPGTVCCGNGQCCPPGESGTCLTDGDCPQRARGGPCEGVRCEAGRCTPFLVSCAPGFICCGGGQCCPGDDECTPGPGCPPPPIDPCLDGLLAGDICLSGLR